MTTPEEIWLRLEELSYPLLDSLETKCAEFGFDPNVGAMPLDEAVLDVRRFRDYWWSTTINRNPIQLAPSAQDSLLAILTDLCRNARAISCGSNKVGAFTAATARLLSICWQNNVQDSLCIEAPTKAKNCIGLLHWIDRHKEDTLSTRVENWLKSFRMSGKDKRWAEIGEEVLERKTLWLTAAAELAAQRVPGVDVYKVSATDVFVEKAQKAITDRAVRYHRYGWWVALGTVVAMAVVCVFLWDSMSKLSEAMTTDYHPLQFVVIVMRLLTVGALVGGIGYFLIGIARALLHEGTALYSRRHALRFGRLYVYLKGGEIKDVDELEKAFKWNDAVHTAFGDIRPDKATKTFAQMVSDFGIETIKVGASAVEKVRDKKDQGK